MKYVGLAGLIFVLPAVVAAETSFEQLSLAAKESGSAVTEPVIGPEPSVPDRRAHGPQTPEPSWKEAAACHFKWILQHEETPDPETVEGYLKVYSLLDLWNRIPSYKASIEFIQPQPPFPTRESTDVQTESSRDRAKIHDAVTDGSLGQAVYEKLHLPEGEIDSVETYDVGHQDDGSLAMLLIFRDKDGVVLGQAGAVGWRPFLCEPN